MKLRLLLIASTAALFILGLGTTVAWSVWYAESHTPEVGPDAVEQSRVALEQQFDQSQKQEAGIEKLYWNQPEKLNKLIDAHKQRIARLTGNPAAAAIVAHDQQSVVRLTQRIDAIDAAIDAARAAAAEAAAEAEKQAAIEASEQGQADRNGAPEAAHATAQHATAPHATAAHTTAQHATAQHTITAQHPPPHAQ